MVIAIDGKWIWDSWYAQDGDRWHGNGWRARGLPSFDDELNHENSTFWKTKILRNMQRDREVTELLRRDGWLVYRAWASDIERDVIAVADGLESVVRGALMEHSK